MSGRIADRIEWTADAGAAALFALAAAYALAALAPGVAASAGGALALGLCFAALRAVAPERRRSPAAEPVGRNDSEPLLLTDVLPGIEEESRVVRLFDPAAMPRPRPFNDRSPSDASQELSDALADLRRSLN